MGKFIVLTPCLNVRKTKDDDITSITNLIVVNTDYIVSFNQIHSGTYVYMTHGPFYMVKESADRIMELINEDILNFV